ncbi:MAG: FlgD immunoglobulin-like domain containing protein [Candidatus Tenebribacter burtonii]|jgi:hypothetical protein|nr:FlgD immunoglobulin-like domain containing protein [Candidatus Tenebribacter burtonii]
MKKTLLCYFLSFLISLCFADIQVSGHLTEDTTWSPENNSYLITDNLFIDSGVTLTILPGCEIKISGAILTDYTDHYQNFRFTYSSGSIAKNIFIDGRIIAEGTEQDPIIFTRLQNDYEYCWGNINSGISSQLNIFKHCKFEHSAGMKVVNDRRYFTLFLADGNAIIQNCEFLNNIGTLGTDTSVNLLAFFMNISHSDNNFNDYLSNQYLTSIFIGQTNQNSSPPLIADNIFTSEGRINISSCLFIDNDLNSSYGLDIYDGTEPLYVFDNNFYDCGEAIDNDHYDETNVPIYFKNNFLSHSSITIEDTYCEIVDNYLEDSSIYFDTDTNGKVINNIIDGGRVRIYGDVDFHNNIQKNYESPHENAITILNPVFNNIILNNSEVINDHLYYYNFVFTNCILLGNEELHGYTSHDLQVSFRNCIHDFDDSWEFIDLGGNIFVDLSQAQSFFEDFENGDYHLVDGSLAIDAGFNTPNYFPFDFDYQQRVYDGNGNGESRIDIGPYEFAAPQMGKISGYILETTTGNPISYTLLKIDNDPGNYTFSDNTGYFEISLQAGTYDIFAERVFYENVSMSAITIDIAQNIGILLYMDSIIPSVSNNEETISPVLNSLNASNFPNPFNPTTTITYELPTRSEVEISIYNTKGQKVKQLVSDLLPEGRHFVVWNGQDENGNSVSSGVYIYKVQTEQAHTTKKILMLK